MTRTTFKLHLHVPADAGLYRFNMLKSTMFDIKIIAKGSYSSSALVSGKATQINRFISCGYRMHTLLLPGVLLISLGMSESFSGLCCR